MELLLLLLLLRHMTLRHVPIGILRRIVGWVHSGRDDASSALEGASWTKIGEATLARLLVEAVEPFDRDVMKWCGRSIRDASRRGSVWPNLPMRRDTVEWSVDRTATYCRLRPICVR
jgi:hypothetical protein